MSSKYIRVIPRDLFNEAKLLKCIGQLALMVHDRNSHLAGITIEHLTDDVEGFVVAQDQDTGMLSIQNMVVRLGDEVLVVATCYNSKSPYPLVCQRGGEEAFVFNDDGTLTQDFINLIKE